MSIYARLIALASVPKYKVGDRVRRHPKWWPKKKGFDEAHNVGTVHEVTRMKYDNGKEDHGYRFISDHDKKHGVMNHFTGKKEKAKGHTYGEKELVPHKEK